MDMADGNPLAAPDRQKEEFILFMMEVICLGGAMASFVIGDIYSETHPGAELVGAVVALILLGSVFERGALSSRIPTVFRNRMWWFGPAFSFALILLKTTIETIPVLPSWDDLPFLAEFSLIWFGSWIAGAGLKRLLVRGRFEQAYRGMVAKSGESLYDFDWRFFILTLILVVIVDLLAFWSDGEDFLEALSASVVFFIVVTACVPFFTGGRSSPRKIPSEKDLSKDSSDH